MNKKMKPIGAIILGSAIIWAAAIIGCAYALKGTECYDKIQYILVGGVLSHLLLIWVPMALQFKKLKTE
jgi:hypothetical protein